jgi:predicted PurR-regulated permease PerM
MGWRIAKHASLQHHAPKGNLPKVTRCTRATAMNRLQLDLDPVLKLLLAIALTGFVMALINLGASLLTPILLGVYIAALAFPLYRALAARLSRRPVALLASVAVITLAAAGLVLLLLFSAGTLRNDLMKHSAQMLERMRASDGVLSVLSFPENASETLASLLNQVLTWLALAVLGSMGSLLFGVVLAAFLLLQSHQLAALLQTNVMAQPGLRELPEVMRTVVRYFGIRTRLNLMTGAGMTIFLWVLGIDHAPLWGVLVFFLSFVPYIGIVIAMTPPVLLGFAEHGWITALLCIVAAAVVNLSIENVIEPNYTGQKLRLSPAIVLVAFFVFVWMLGPLGAALAMPLTVFILLMCERHPSTHWLAQLLTGGKSAQPAPASV